MKTLKVQHHNGDISYGSMVKKSPISIVLELDSDKRNYVFSPDGFLIHCEGESDLMMVAREDLPRLDEMMTG